MVSSIGTLNENPLHASLKHALARPGDALEAPVGRYCVDIRRGDLLIEVQTANFSAARAKLRALVEEYDVHLVHPIATTRWIVRPANPRSQRSVRRKSPKHGRIEDIFVELVSIPDLLAHPRFTLEVLLTHEEEVRKPAPRRRRRRSNWAVVERRLVDVVGSRSFTSIADLARLLPEGLPEHFTTADLASAMGRPRWLAQKAAYCLSRSGAIDFVGKSANSHLYARA